MNICTFIGDVRNLKGSKFTERENMKYLNFNVVWLTFVLENDISKVEYRSSACTFQ
jgi:hypothetical protein